MRSAVSKQAKPELMGLISSSFQSTQNTYQQLYQQNSMWFSQRCGARFIRNTCRNIQTFVVSIVVVLLISNQNLAYATPQIDAPKHMSTRVQQSSFTSVERTLPLVVDEANLLDDAEEQVLVDLYEHLTEENQCEIAVVTVKSLSGKTPEAYADDFYDYNGYGYGADDDGIMLLVSMADRDWHVTTHGAAYLQLTEDRLDWLMGDVLPLLSSGDYFAAFEAFGYNSATLMKMDIPETIGDTGGGLDGESVIPYSRVTVGGVLKWLVISLAVGAVAAYFWTFQKSAKHKTVRLSQGAQPYLQQARTNAAPASERSQYFSHQAGSPTHVRRTALLGLAGALLLRRQSDVFLRTSTSRTAINTSSGSGSSSSGGFGGHSSSSGRTHGGGGGKFIVANQTINRLRVY